MVELCYYGEEYLISQDHIREHFSQDFNNKFYLNTQSHAILLYRCTCK